MKISRLLCFILVFLLLALPVFAHPGKTDDNGGHTDHSTGTYHYHHGYEAHYHTGGACPFDFDDQTDHSYHGSSMSSATSSSDETGSFWDRLVDLLDVLERIALPTILIWFFVPILFWLLLERLFRNIFPRVSLFAKDIYDKKSNFLIFLPGTIAAIIYLYLALF